MESECKISFIPYGKCYNYILLNILQTHANILLRLLLVYLGNEIIWIVIRIIDAHDHILYLNVKKLG